MEQKAKKIYGGLSAKTVLALNLSMVDASREILQMRLTFILLATLTMTGCSVQPMAHYSPYDLNRDGVMDAVCPGMVYDTSKYRHYSWRAEGSKECNEKVAQQKAAG